VDVELPTGRCYGEPLRRAVAAGEVPEELVDRALRRVLAPKVELGLLDPDWSPLPPDVDELLLDTPAARDVALRLARESVVLLRNDGALPLRPGSRIALVGPLADDPTAMLGCYSFPAHIGVHHPDVPLGLDVPTVLDALRDGLRDGRGEVVHVRGCEVRDGGVDPAAVEAAAGADVCVVAVGDLAGLFGRGTSGEGCDATTLTLPGPQEDLVRAVLDTGTPVVLLLITGRPYAVGHLAARAAATAQCFFPGQLGGRAIADVLTGAVSPSGRLPVSIPADPSGQPGTYLSAKLGLRTEVSDVDPTPAFPFGHGLGYDAFTWSAPRVDRADWPTDGAVELELDVHNPGGRAGADVVQLYLHDPVAQVTRPVVRLIGYARVPLAPGATARVRFRVPADVTSFTGLDGRRVVEPGEVRLRVSRSSADPHHEAVLDLVGPPREVDHTRERLTTATVKEVVG
jgi:beta-glucosidase